MKAEIKTFLYNFVGSWHIHRIKNVKNKKLQNDFLKIEKYNSHNRKDHDSRLVWENAHETPSQRIAGLRGKHVSSQLDKRLTSRGCSRPAQVGKKKVCKIPSQLKKKKNCWSWWFMPVTSAMQLWWEA
jgi:hypothetical protein